MDGAERDRLVSQQDSPGHGLSSSGPPGAAAGTSNRAGGGARKGLSTVSRGRAAGRSVSAVQPCGLPDARGPGGGARLANNDRKGGQDGGAGCRAGDLPTGAAERLGDALGACAGTIPTSVTIPATNAAGVTSNAGLRAAVPAGATRTRAISPAAVSALDPQHLVGVALLDRDVAPRARVVRSIVVSGAAT